MKKLVLILVLSFLSTLSFAQAGNDALTTGDNFSLEGALALFKNSKSIEEFESLINMESSNVNNLDLNDDGKTDYISVNDIMQNDSHVLVLSTDLSATEKQDIATINIEKTGNEQVSLQIIGDVDLYAENTVVEPFETAETLQNSKGPSSFNIEINRFVMNVWFWPSVRFLYAPNYVVWRSPYRWAFYPKLFRPWRPFGYSAFYARCAPHRIYYRRTPNFRMVSSRNFYAPRRNHSTIVVHTRRGTTVVRTNSRVNTRNFNNRNRGRR